MGTKKNTSIWIDPDVLKQLKHLGVEYGVPMGDIIHAALKVVGVVEPALFKQAIIGIRDTVAVYVGDDEEQNKIKARMARDLQRMDKTSELHNELFGPLPNKDEKK